MDGWFTSATNRRGLVKQYAIMIAMGLIAVALSNKVKAIGDLVR